LLISRRVELFLQRQRSQPNQHPCLRQRAASCLLRAIAPVTGAMLLAVNPVPN
jgi:hypothetical protein